MGKRFGCEGLDVEVEAEVSEETQRMMTWIQSPSSKSPHEVHVNLWVCSGAYIVTCILLV